jgi:hypothetical protein
VLDKAIGETLVDNIPATRPYGDSWPDRKHNHWPSWVTQYHQQFQLHANDLLKCNALLCATGYARFLRRQFD